MGTEYEFETDKNHNYEGNISMNIELKKTCYSMGEIIHGNLYLLPKNTSYPTQIINPYAEITLREQHFYTYNGSYYDNYKKETIITKINEEENVILLTQNMIFPYNMDLNISNGSIIPFEIKVPNTSYPSCFFDSSSYVKHFLSISFPSIGAKKTVIIIIKNGIYFSSYNGLLKTPTIIKNEITKHKYIFFNYGSFKFSITLPKNIYSYNENVQFLIEIDCPNLSININGIKVSLYRISKKNYKRNHQTNRSKQKTDLVSKYISLTEGEKYLHIEDNIKLPVDYNPKSIYSKLDNDNRRYKDKFNNIKLFPSCYGGLLTCEYFIKFVFDLDSLFTTNEEFSIPLDFYELFNDFTAEPKKFELNPYDTYQTSNKNYTDQNGNTIKDDEFPDEKEIYMNKNNNNKDNNNNNKPEGDNNTDGDAPPPSFS